MAKNTNKRVATKHIRDKIKSQYPPKIQCAICGTEEDLEGHHYATLSLVLNTYCKEHNIPIDTDEQVIAMREQFYEDNWEAVVTDMVTLCAEHHKAIHKVYGKVPPLTTINKQKHWVIRMFEKKTNGLEGRESQSPNNRFSKHIPRMRVDFASII